MAPGSPGCSRRWSVFGGWLFGFALQLQDGLGDSALRAGLTFAPAAVAFALVSLNWQRLPARYHGAADHVGFVAERRRAARGRPAAAAPAATAAPGVRRGRGGGRGMAAAFGPLMTRVLSRVPVAIAADASGVIVTVNQLGIVVGVATFGSLVPEPGRATARARVGAFALSSAHAYQTTSVALAGLAVVGMVLALGHVRSSRWGREQDTQTRTRRRDAARMGRDRA